MRKLLSFLLTLTVSTAAGIDLQQKSVSRTKQFVVYCEDSLLRLKVISFAEDTKSSILSLLALRDEWRFPIVFTIDRASAAAPGAPASQLILFETEDSAKIELRVKLSSLNPNLRQQIVRAILLELAHRKSGLKSGVQYAQPPSWLVEAIVQHQVSRDSGQRPDVYNSMLARNQVPSLMEFLKTEPARLDSTSLNYYRACAFAFLELLVDMPAGQSSLASYVRGLPSSGKESLAEIRSHFPALGESDQTLEKWWSLSIARLAASSRHQGLSLQATEDRLKALLLLPIQVSGEKREFSLDQYKKFVKLPKARALLRQRQNELLWLSVDANLLFRPIVLDYQRLVSQLARGKTNRVGQKLAQLATYREAIMHRLSEISDYMNWLEATQGETRSDLFAGYMHVANSLATPPPKLGGPISQYLDALEVEFR